MIELVGIDDRFIDARGRAKVGAGLPAVLAAVKVEEVQPDFFVFGSARLVASRMAALARAEIDAGKFGIGQADDRLALAIYQRNLPRLREQLAQLDPEAHLPHVLLLY